MPLGVAEVTVVVPEPADEPVGRQLVAGEAKRGNRARVSGGHGTAGRWQQQL